MRWKKGGREREMEREREGGKEEEKKHGPQRRCIAPLFLVKSSFEFRPIPTRLGLEEGGCINNPSHIDMDFDLGYFINNNVCFYEIC